MSAYSLRYSLSHRDFDKIANFAVKPCNSTEFSALLQALEAKKQCLDECLVFEFGKASFCRRDSGINILFAMRRRNKASLKS